MSYYDRAQHCRRSHGCIAQRDHDTKLLVHSLLALANNQFSRTSLLPHIHDRMDEIEIVVAAFEA